MKFNWGVFSPLGAYFFARKFWGYAILSVLLSLSAVAMIRMADINYFLGIWVLFSIWSGFQAAKLIEKSSRENEKLLDRSEAIWTVIGISSLVFVIMFFLGNGPLLFWYFMFQYAFSFHVLFFYPQTLWVLWIPSLAALVPLFVIFKFILRFSILEFMRGLTIALMLCLLLPLPALLTTTYIAKPFYVTGVAMEPNFHANDYVMVDLVSYRLYSPRRGDVIIYHYPINTAYIFIRRIIGLPGENVQIHKGNVYIDGKQITELYIASRQASTEGTWQLGQDQYFVMADNRPDSSDSKVWAPVLRNLIVGKVRAIVYPLRSFSVIPSIDYGEGL